MKLPRAHSFHMTFFRPRHVPPMAVNPRIQAHYHPSAKKNSPFESMPWSISTRVHFGPPRGSPSSTTHTSRSTEPRNQSAKTPFSRMPASPTPHCQNLNFGMVALDIISIHSSPVDDPCNHEQFWSTQTPNVHFFIALMTSNCRTRDSTGLLHSSKM
jgi:hypothetical protein